MARNASTHYRSPLPGFQLKQGTELFTDQTGLSLVVLALEEFEGARQAVGQTLPKRSGLSIGQIVLAYVGLLSQGKSNFDAIEYHREDGFFADALGISGVSAASPPRMQMDAQAEKMLPLIDQSSVALLKKSGATITPLPCGLVPVDIDVPAMNNAKKEGHYVGLELHEEMQHSSKEKQYTRALPRMMALAELDMLARLGFGFHSTHPMHEIESTSQIRIAAGGEAVHFLIKSNPHGKSLQATHDHRVESQDISCLPRDGKLVWIRATQETSWHESASHRRIHRLIERTLKANDQMLLVTDLNLERLHPQSVCRIRKSLKRQRLRCPRASSRHGSIGPQRTALSGLSVVGRCADMTPPSLEVRTILEKINLSAKVVGHARRLILNSGRHFRAVFQRLYGLWSTGVDHSPDTRFDSRRGDRSYFCADTVIALRLPPYISSACRKMRCSPGTGDTAPLQKLEASLPWVGASR